MSSQTEVQSELVLIAFAGTGFNLPGVRLAIDLNANLGTNRR